MAIGTLAAFWAVSFLLVLVPGADWAYAIAAGLRDRRSCRRWPDCWPVMRG